MWTVLHLLNKIQLYFMYGRTDWILTFLSPTLKLVQLSQNQGRRKLGGQGAKRFRKEGEIEDILNSSAPPLTFRLL